MRKFAAALAALLVWATTAQAINYPTTLDGVGSFGTAVHGQPVLATTINALRDAVIALETKVGTNSSLTITTIDFLLTSTSSTNPGHMHTGASLSNIDASTITIGTLSDSRLSANVALKNAANTWALLQTFSSGITVTGTATATTFSGSGASLTNIPETAITNGTILARVADNETISGNWTFSNPPTADGSLITNILEANISNGVLLARVGDNETISGTWTFNSNTTFVGNIAKIRNQPMVWPPANASGALNNDGSGNLSWVAAGAPVTPGGATGAVQFNTGGAFNGDATTFFWDNAAKRLGIGTNTPAVPLHVVGVVRSTAVAGVGNRCLEADSTGNLVATSTTCATAVGASGASGSVQFAFGGAFASDATNLFWDDTNNRLGITTNTPATTLDVASGTITSGDHIPTADNAFNLGSPSFRWASLHLGPSSLKIHNDNTGTVFATFGFTTGVSTWSASAGTPIAVTASAAAGTNPLKFTADTTSGTSSTQQFIFQMANTGAPNVNPLRGVYIAEPANSFTGTQTNLYVEAATKASGDKFSAEFAGATQVDTNFFVGDNNVQGARFAVDNGAASHGAAGTIIEKLKQHASQSGNVFQVQTSSDNIQWAIGANGFTVMGGVNATIGTDRLRLIGSTADNTANALLVQDSSATGTLFTVRNDGQATHGGTVIAGTDNSFDIGNSTTGSFRTGYFDTSVVSPLFTFGGALSITTTASNGDITLDANGTGNIIAADVVRPNADNTIDLGTSGNSWRTLYADTSVLTPLVSFAGALSITTTASNGDITLDPNGTGSVVYSTDVDYSNKAVCYVNASGKLGHCTTSDASSCGCTAN